MKPVFYRAAKDLPNESGYLAICNIENSNKMATKYNVFVFPTLKLFSWGHYIEDYAGQRRSLELVKYMMAHSEKINKQN